MISILQQEFNKQCRAGAPRPTRQQLRKHTGGHFGPETLAPQKDGRKPPPSPPSTEGAALSQPPTELQETPLHTQRPSQRKSIFCLPPEHPLTSHPTAGIREARWTEAGGGQCSRESRRPTPELYSSLATIWGNLSSSAFPPLKEDDWWLHSVWC